MFLVRVRVSVRVRPGSPRLRCWLVQCLVRYCFLIHGWSSSHCVLTWWEKGVLQGLLYKGANPIHEGSTLMTESPPQSPASTSHHRGLGFQCMNLEEGHKHLVHCSYHNFFLIYILLFSTNAETPMGFPCGSAGKESACSVGDLGLIPGLGRSPGEGKGYPLQYSGLENSMNCIVNGDAKSPTRLSKFHFH